MFGKRDLKSPSVKKVRAALKDAGQEPEFKQLKGAVANIGAAAEELGVEPGAVVQTQIYLVGEQPILVLVAGDHNCKPDALARALALDGLGEVRSTDEAEIVAASGFEAGGVAPVALAMELPTVIDVSLKRFETVYVPAGHPKCVFASTAKGLSRLTGGIISYAIAEPA